MTALASWALIALISIGSWLTARITAEITDRITHTTSARRRTDDE